MPDGGNARGSETISGLTAEIAVPDWARHSGAFARVGDTLMMTGPDGETFSIAGYFAQVPRPVIVTEDGRPLSVSAIQAALAEAHDQQVAQAVGVPGPAGDIIDPADDPALGNVDLVGLGGQQNPGGPQIPSEALEKLLTSVAAGDNVEQALQAVFQEAAQEAIARGSSPQEALQQYEAFADILSSGIAEGVSPAQALSEANAVFLNLSADAQGTGNAAKQILTPEQAALNAVASGENTAQLNGSEAFQQALADALQSGARVDQALDSANIANANVQQALAQTATGTADPLLAALASGENLGAIPAGADFQQALADALANGASPNEALQTAAAAVDAVSNAQNAVATGGGDPTLQAIASGDASAISGSPEMIAALSDALQSGANVDAAISVAAQADAAIANAVAQTATGTADPVLQAIASGDAGAIGGSPEMIAALSDALQGGAPVDAAMAVATQTGAAINDAVTQTATGTADPIMQMLASGNTEGLGDNPILIAALNDALANNTPPSEAMQQAQQTQEAIANAQQTTNVGGGDNGGAPVVASNDNPGTGGNSQTGDTGGTGGSETGGGEPIQVADAGNAVTATNGGGSEGQGSPMVNADAGGTGGGSATKTDDKPPPFVFPDFSKANAEAKAAVAFAAPVVEQVVQAAAVESTTFVSSTNPSGEAPEPEVVVVQETPQPEPVGFKNTPPSQIVLKEGSSTDTSVGWPLDLSPFFSGDGLTYSVSGLPSWADLQGNLIVTKSGMSAEADGSGQTTLVITAMGFGDPKQISVVLRVDDMPQIDTDNLATETFVPIDGDPVAVDPRITLGDADEPADFDGATLTVTVTYGGTDLPTTDDLLSVLSIGTSPGQINVSGNIVRYGSTDIATIEMGSGVGTVPLVITFSGDATEAAIQALMRAIGYQNTNENITPGTAPTITMTLTIAGVDVSFARPVEMVDNVQPNSSGVSETINEDASHTFSASDFPFVDGDGDTLQQVRIDSLPDPARGELLFHGNPISAGTIIDIGDIGLLTFVPAANVNDDVNGAPAEKVEFTYSVSDGKQFQATPSTAEIAVTQVNDVPTMSIAGASVQFHPDTAATLIAPNIQIGDIDAATVPGELADGYLEIDIDAASRSVGDRLTIKAIGGITLDGSNVKFGADVIGTIDSTFNGSANQKLRIDFNTANATPEAIQALARAIAFDNVDAEPGGGARTVTFTINDGDSIASSASATATVSIAGVSDHFNDSSTVRVFDGSDSVSLGNSSDFINGNATTWEAWIKTEQTTGTQTIIGAGSTASSTVIDTNFNSSSGLTLAGEAYVSGGRLRLTVDEDGGQSDSEGSDWVESTSTSGEISVGGTASGSVGSSMGVDWIKVSLVEGHQYVIDILGQDSGGGRTLEDPDLEGIYDENGNPLSGYSGDTGGVGDDAHHTFTAPYTGDYYIAVNSSTGTEGTYDLTVRHADGQHGIARIAPPSGTAGATNFSASFNLYIDNPSGSIADGFSFNYGVPGFRGLGAEEGLTTGLSITFDTFDNGTSDDTGIEIWFNGSRIGAANTAIDFTDAAGKAVTVAYTDSGLTVTVGGSTVVSDLVIPGYEAAGKSAYQYIVGARTASVSSTQEIDNLVITAENTTSTYNALVVKDGMLVFTEGFRDGVQTNSSTTTVADGNWHHVAMSHDGDQTLKLYVDGQLVQTLTGVTKEILAGSGWIGRNPDSAADHFNGEIAEVRVWGDVRDAVEIAANYLPGLPNPGAQSDLISYWNFDGQMGSSIDDSANGNHDGTVSGAISAERPEFANWRVVEGSGNDDSIVVADGEALLRNRELLQTFDQLDPGATNPVHLTGRFSFENAGDALHVLTRADAGTLANGLPANGIAFKVDDVTNALTILKIEAGVTTALTLAGDASLNLTTGIEYAFDILDDGTNLYLSVHEVGASGNSATVTASSSFNPATNYIVVTNGQETTSDHVVHLSDIRIDDDLVMPEGSMLSGTLSAPSPLTGALAYEVIDVAGHGNFSITDAAAGTYEYTPDAGYHGRDFITYKVTDASGRTHVENVVFDVVADTDVQIAGAHLDFDGSNDYVTMGAGVGNSLQIKEDLTVEGWFKIDELKTANLVTIAGPSGDGTAANNFLFLMQLHADGRISLFHESGTGATQAELFFDAGIEVGDWVHLAAVRNTAAKTYSLYADGVLIGTQSYGTDPDGGTAAQMMLGAELSSGGTPDKLFHGSMDEIRIWDNARSEDDIRLNYNQNASGSEDGLVGYWTFDNVVDGTAIDQSNNGNHAQFGGTRLGDSAEPEVDDGSSADLPDINGGTVTIAEDTTIDGQMTPDTALVGAVTYSVQSAGDKGGTVTIDADTGHWTYTPLAKFYGTETFIVRAAGSTSGTDDETITVTVEQHSIPSVDIGDNVLQLDGADDYVDLGTLSGLGATGAITMEAWVNFADFDAGDNDFGWMRIFDFGQGQADDNVFLAIDNVSGRVNFSSFDGAAGTGFSTADPIALNEWVHVAAVNNGDGSGAIYINGELAATINSGLAPVSDVDRDHSYIGRSGWSVDDHAHVQIDDARIWTTARTAEEIATYYDRQLNGDEDGLYANWRFDNVSGTSVPDQATAGLHGGTLANGASIAPPLGTALSFDGIDDVATVASDAALDTAQGTWSIWVNTAGDWGTDNAAGDDATSFMSRHSSSSSLSGINLGVNTAGGIFVNIKDGTGSVADMVSGSGFADSQWHMVTVTFDQAAGSLQKLYVDDVLVGTATTSGAWTFDGQDLLFGKSADSYWEEFKGKLDDARVYGRELSGQEVADLYANGGDAISGLVGRWDFDDDNGQTIQDGAGSLDGTLGAADTSGTDDPASIDTGAPVHGTALTINENETVSGAMTDNDVAGTAIYGIDGGVAIDGRVTVETEHGTIAIDTTSGAWTYTPDENYHGTDSFTLTASGLHGTSDSETVTVTIADVPHNSVDVSDGVLSLDGSTGYARVGDLNATFTDMTVETWVKLDDLSGGLDMLLASDGTWNANDLHLQWHGNFLKWNEGGESNELIFAHDFSQDVGSWVHIAVVKDTASDTLSLYLDGELVERKALPAFQASNTLTLSDARIGAWNAGDRHLDGALDDFRIWNTARSAEEIRAHYDQQLSGSESGLQADWRFDDFDAAGGILDSSADSHNGILAGGAEIDNLDGGPESLGTDLVVYGHEGASGRMIANDVIDDGIAYGIFNGTTTVTSFNTAHGTVTIDAGTGAWTYIPAAGYTGADSFILRASGGGLTDSETVNVTVKNDDRANVSNGVVQLRGGSDRITFADAADMGAGSLTVEAWVHFDNNQADGSIRTVLAKGSADGTDAGFAWYFPAGSDVLTMRVGDGTETRTLTIDTSDSGEIGGGWHHVAMVVDRVNHQVAAYVDGMAQAHGDFNSTANIDTGSHFVVGNSSTSDGAWAGMVDELRVWNTARTADQVHDNHDKRLPDQSGLSINYHAGDPGSRSVLASDVEESHVHVLGRGLQLDGNGDAAALSGVDLNNQSFSWELWANRAAADGTDLVLGARGTAEDANSFLHAGWTSPTNFRFGFNGTGSNNQIDYTDTGSVGEWHHWAGTFDAATRLAKLYKDGVLVATATFADVLDTDAGLVIGGSQTADHAFNGTIDEVRLWNDVRTDAEIAQHYNEVIAGDADGLIGNYHFSESSGTALDSATGVDGANDGTLVGDATRIETAPDIYGTALTIEENETASGRYDVDGTNFTISTAAAHGTVAIDSVSGAWVYTPTANYYGTDSFTVNATGAGPETIQVTIARADVVSTTVGASAVHFDGVDDYVSLPSDSVRTADMTIETWFKWDGTGGAWQRLFDFGATASNPQDYMFLTVNADGTNKLRFAINNDAATEQQLNYALATPVDTWTHVAVTIDSVNNTAKLYVNGELVAVNTSMTFDPSQLDAFTSMLIGKSNYPDALYKGDMSDFRIWTTARTDEQIRDNYDQRITGDQAGLAVNYTFDDVANAIVQDGTSGNHDATIVGDANVTDPVVDVPIHGTALVINEDETASGRMTGSDVVGTPTYSVTAQPVADTGTVSIDASTGAWTYTPPENWHGTASFTVTAAGGGLTDTETVTVTVKEDHEPDVQGGALQLDGIDDTFVADISATSSTVAVGALNFSGTDDYVQLPNAALNNLPSGTIEAWIKAPSSGVSGGLITSKQHDGVNSTGIFGFGQSGWINAPGGGMQLFWHGSNAAGDKFSTASVPTDGAWHHVAVSFTGTTIEFYIDGVSAGSATANSSAGIPNISGGSSTLGGLFSPSFGSGLGEFGGAIAEVRIWDDVRTSAEIADNYTKRLTGAEDNLHAYYRLDDAGQTVADSAGSADGTLGPNAGGSAGSGNDPAPSAAGPTLTVTNVPSINLAAAFTMELWMRTTATGVVQTLMSKSENGVWEAGGKQLGIDADGKVFFDAFGGGTELTGTNASVADGDWHHVAFTYDGTTGKIYVDGAAAGSAAMNLPADDIAHDLFIGSRANADQGFKGEIDEVRIWSEARSATEIEMNHDQQVDPDQSTLEAYYRMDDLAGGVIHDATGNGNDIAQAPTDHGPTGNVLTLDGTNDYVTISVGSTTTGGISLPGSYSFDGTDDHIRLENGALNNLSSGTIEAWIYLDTNTNEVIAAKQHDGHNTTAVFSVGTGINYAGHTPTPGKLYFHAYNDANAESTATVSTGVWHHVAVAFNSTSATFYIDGVASGTTSGNFSVPNVNDGTFAGATSIGAILSNYQNTSTPTVNNALDGKIAEVRIWETTRTAGEISANYQTQLTGNESGLRSYYPLDSAVTSFVDDGPQNFAGSLGSSGDSFDDPTFSGAETAFATVTPDINFGPDIAFTMEAWIKTSVAAGGTIRTILAKSETGSWQSGSKQLAIDGTGKVFFESNGGSGAIVGTSTVSDGEWHHVAFTYSSGTGTIYVDGVAESSGSITLPADDADHEIFIGSHTGGGQYFSGEIDEVRIWSDARSASEIRDGMTEHYDYDTAGLEARYTFDNANGTAIADDAATYDGGGRGDAQNGTLTNGATLADSGSGDPLVVDPPAAALSFDGTDDSVTFGNNVGATGSGARTFMLWAKTTSATDQTFFSYGTQSVGGAFGFGLNLWKDGGGGGQGLSLDVWGAAITFQPVTATDDGQWHHYAVVMEAGDSLRDLKVYQDGVLLTGIIALANGNDQAINTASGNNFALGTYINGGHDFAGQMADVSVWSSALTTAQIRDYMTDGLSGSESNLTALWRLDEGTGTSLGDSSANSFTGTVNGATWVDAAPDVDGNFLQIVENGSANGRMTPEDISGAATYSLFGGPDHGTMQLNSVTGEWTYVPNDGYQGTDSFTLRATGATSGVDDELVSIKVGEAPTADPTDSVLVLDGSTGHVDVGTLDHLSGAMTIEAWIKWDGAGAVSGSHEWARIVDFGTGQDGDNILLAANGSTGELSFDIRHGANNQSIKTMADMPLDQWIHVAATTNGTGSGSLYINGVQQTLQGGSTVGAIWSALDVSRTSSFIGESNWATESTSDYQITDVRVWNVERTATQIAENYDRRLSGDETGLYSYWKLDEGSGSVAVDSSGNGHDGAVVGGASYASQSQIEITGGSAYKGLILGADSDNDTLSYSVDTDAGNGPDHGTFTFNTDSNTYTYDPTDGYTGDDSVTVDVTDDHGQTIQHTIQFHLT